MVSEAEMAKVLPFGVNDMEFPALVTATGSLDGVVSLNPSWKV